MYQKETKEIISHKMYTPLARQIGKVHVQV